MALGASYAGRLAVTGSAGPGISLKTEAIGWASMAEMPVDCDQRAARRPEHRDADERGAERPASAIFGGHGDSPRVVLAPPSVEDCFYTAIEAVNIARKYSTPVIILSDSGARHAHRGVPRAATWQTSDGRSRRTSRRATASLQAVSRSMASRSTRRPARAMASGKYPVVTGLEHDEMGHPTGSPKLHTQMTAKRRNKLQQLAEELPLPRGLRRAGRRRAAGRLGLDLRPDPARR